MNKEAIFEMELQIYLGNPDKFQLYINKKYYQNLKEKIQLYIISISQWVSDNKDLCSLTISLAAFIFTIFTYYVSKKRSEYDKKISDARYKEQKMQYENIYIYLLHFAYSQYHLVSHLVQILHVQLKAQPSHNYFPLL